SGGRPEIAPQTRGGTRGPVDRVPQDERRILDACELRGERLVGQDDTGLRLERAGANGQQCSQQNGESHDSSPTSMYRQVGSPSVNVNKIGRASCRERVSSSADGRTIERTT